LSSDVSSASRLELVSLLLEDRGGAEDWLDELDGVAVDEP
jgi:hypothetical protein